jgi:hypothetical protein
MIRALIAAVAFVPCMILLLPAFAVSLALAAFAATVRGLGRRLEPRFTTWTDLIEYHPVLGWKPRPNLDVHYLALGDDVFRIVTDKEGWSGRRSLDDSDLVVIGDSFAFGYGIDTERSFAELSSRLKVKAVGAPGFNMAHGVLLMEQFAERLRGKLVVWMPFFDNDLQDNLAPEMRGYRAPFVRPSRAAGPDGKWEIVVEHIDTRRWNCSYMDNRRLLPRLCITGPLADRAYSACDYLIQRAAMSCRQVDAQLVIVTIPHVLQLTQAGLATLATLSGDAARCDGDLPDRRIAESCRRAGVPLVIGKQCFTRADYKRREGIHWNRRGHMRMSALLERLHDSFRSRNLDDLIPHHTGPKTHREVLASVSAGSIALHAVDGVPLGAEASERVSVRPTRVM